MAHDIMARDLLNRDMIARDVLARDLQGDFVVPDKLKILSTDSEEVRVWPWQRTQPISTKKTSIRTWNTVDLDFLREMIYSDCAATD
eukprot:2319614-Rhodomonas_salina.2